jgi:hypothetical protein
MADAYKTLIQAAIPTASAMIGAAVPGAKSWIVGKKTVVNTNATGTLWFQLFKNGTSAAYAISGQILVPAGQGVENDELSSMAAAEYIAGVASGTGFVLMVDGDEVS